MSAKNPMMSPPHPALAQQSFFRLSVADYHEMGAAGILTPDDRVELLDGFLVVKPMQKSHRASTVARLVRLLIVNCPKGWTPRSQLPITLIASEPEPDGVFARGDEHTYDTRHPNSSETGVVIEVSHSTLRLDREVKLPIYAQENIAVYWIINLVDNYIEVYSNPEAFKLPASYATQTIYKPGDAVPIVLDGATVGTIAVSDLLP